MRRPRPTFCWYEPELVPDLLQTQDYARTVISAGTPAASPTELDRRVQLRMMQQELIHRESMPPDLRVALSDGILRRRRWT